MPINCNQPIRGIVDHWSEWIPHHFFEHKVSRNSIEIAAAPADSHGGDHTAQFVAASQGGGGQLPVHFCLLQLWGTRYYIGLFVSSRNE